jgi:RNA polymerase sigma-70 factor, ECF subfamily
MSCRLNSSSEEPSWPWDLARQRCLREARRILRNRDDAEEAVQEALARAWRGRATCRTPATPIPWLLKITRNEAIRLAARRRRRELAEVHLVLDEPARDEPASDTAIERTLTAIATKQALGALGPDERKLIRLRYVYDLTQGQVAEALGVPEGTVKVRLHRARARLRGSAEELAA